MEAGKLWPSSLHIRPVWRWHNSVTAYYYVFYIKIPRWISSANLLLPNSYLILTDYGVNCAELPSEFEFFSINTHNHLTFYLSSGKILYTDALYRVLQIRGLSLGYRKLLKIHICSSIMNENLFISFGFEGIYKNMETVIFNLLHNCVLYDFRDLIFASK